MNKEVFLSILAMDSYQRGYAQGILGVSSTKIGNATISRQSNITTGSIEVAVGFYASAYTWNGETIISYRGTDFDVGADKAQELIKDLKQGWTSFLAPTVAPVFGGNSQFGQARAFFSAVSGGKFSDGVTYSNITVVGHSLGGALAGYVDARSDVKSYLVNPIPYGVTSWVSAIKDAWDATLTEYAIGAVADLLEILLPGYDGPLTNFGTIFQRNLNKFQPSLPDIEGVYLEGEVASRILALQPQLAGLLTGAGLGATLATPLVFTIPVVGPIAALGTITAGALMTALGVFQVITGKLNNAVEDTSGREPAQANYSAADLMKDGLLNGYAKSVQLHSAPLMTMLLYGDKQWSDDNNSGASAGRWRDVVKYIFAGVYDEQIAGSLEIIIDGVSQKLKMGARDGTGLTAAGEQLSRIIAYSAINEGTLVFGDTGIRSLFDDADDMGLLIQYIAENPGITSSAVDEDAKKQMGKLIAEYAGLLATRKVTQVDNADATKGVLSYGSIADNLGFLIDLRDSTWSAGGAYHDSIVKSDLINSFLNTPENGYVNLSTLSDWYGRYAKAGGNLKADIDEIILSLTLGKIAAPRDADGVALQVGTNAGDDVSFGSGTDFVLGGKGDDVLHGGRGSDILLGGEGTDNLFGDGGDDWLQGGTGDDWLIADADAVRDVLNGGSGNDNVLGVFPTYAKCA